MAFTPEEEELERKKVTSIEQGLIAEGRSTTTPQQVDYFGFDEYHTVTFPDGVTWVKHKVLTEGDRRKYQNALNRDVRIQKATGDALLKMASGDEKNSLLMTAIVDWNLIRDGKPVPCNDAQKREFLAKTNPKIVDLIEKDIRKKNAWLQADMTVEDIDKEIESLQEIRQQKVDEEEGKSSLS